MQHATDGRESLSIAHEGDLACGVHPNKRDLPSSPLHGAESGPANVMSNLPDSWPQVGSEFAGAPLKHHSGAAVSESTLGQ